MKPRYIATRRGLPPGRWRVIDTDADDTIVAGVTAEDAKRIAARCNREPPDFWDVVASET